MRANKASPKGQVVLSEAAAIAYDLLLKQDQSGKADEFKIQGVPGFLQKQLKTTSNNLYSRLVHAGLVTPLGKKHSGAKPRTYLVVRRPYEVGKGVTRRRGRSASAKVEKTAAPTVPKTRRRQRRQASKTAKAQPTGNALIEHLKFFSQFRQQMEEADRRNDELRKIGLKVVFKGSEALLAPIK